MKIDHIGYVTSDFDKTLKYFRDQLNMRQITNKIKEPAHGVDVIFLDMGQKGYPALEIIRPNNKKSKVSNFLKKNGDGIHHLAFEVSNVEKKIIELKKKNFLVLSDIVPGAGHNKTPTVWLYSPKNELIELIQKQKGKTGYSRFTK
jgi:methylmalonyl-CoA/ethylmalonyl-CoA epimerase|tara:strand:- start:22 stop:459 length:438 start_codon:yes stop_codon:yes gene_type:complete